MGHFRHVEFPEAIGEGIQPLRVSPVFAPFLVGSWGGTEIRWSGQRKFQDFGSWMCLETLAYSPIFKGQMMLNGDRQPY